MEISKDFSPIVKLVKHHSKIIQFILLEIQNILVYLILMNILIFKKLI